MRGLGRALVRVLDRALCRIGVHDWHQMDGHCAVPGCDAVDDLWLSHR